MADTDVPGAVQGQSAGHDEQLRFRLTPKETLTECESGMTMAFLRLHIYDFYRCIPDLQKYYVGARNESFAFINRLVQAPARTNPPDACISLRV